MNRHERNIAALLSNQTARRLTREEHRRKAQRLRILLTYLCFLALLALMLHRLAVPVTADTVAQENLPETTKTAFTDDGRLPDDDTTDTEVCYIDPEEAENELIELALLEKAHKLDNVTVTHYCTCERCCGWSTGITASGRMATPGVSVGVDPDVIPLWSDVLVDYGDGELHYYRADDTGSGVSGAHIDLCVASHEEAVQKGVRTATAYIIAPKENPT